MLQSYLNMLKVIQNTNGGQEDLKFQIKVKAVVDEDVVQKVNIKYKFVLKVAY